MFTRSTPLLFFHSMMAPRLTLATEILALRQQLYWRRKSKPPVGLPQIDKEIRVLIPRMSHENPLWGAQRIQVDDSGRPLRRFQTNRLKRLLTTPVKIRAHRRKAECPPSGVQVVTWNMRPASLRPRRQPSNVRRGFAMSMGL